MSRIRDVWAPNLETEMANIRDLIEKYPYIAMVRLSFAALWTLVVHSFPHPPISTSFFSLLVCMTVLQGFSMYVKHLTAAFLRFTGVRFTL